MTTEGCPPMRTCSSCKITKTADEFHKSKNDKSLGRTWSCKECNKDRAGSWYQAHKNEEKARRAAIRRERGIPEKRCVKIPSALYRRLWKYGLHHTPEVYSQMISDQNNLCAICGHGEKVLLKNGTPKPLVIDHAHHGDQRVRALLCQACNFVVGWVETSPDMVAKVAAYLAKHAT